MNYYKIRLAVENGIVLKNSIIQIIEDNKSDIILGESESAYDIQVSVRVVNDSLTGMQFEKQKNTAGLLLTIPENGHLWGDILIMSVNDKNGTKELWLKFILDDENSACKTITFTFYERKNYEQPNCTLQIPQLG